jgi:hypothetical protein
MCRLEQGAPQLHDTSKSRAARQAGKPFIVSRAPASVTPAARWRRSCRRGRPCGARSRARRGGARRRRGGSARPARGGATTSRIVSRRSASAISSTRLIPSAFACISRSMARASAISSTRLIPSAFACISRSMAPASLPPPPASSTIVAVVSASYTRALVVDLTGYFTSR